jgi:hypothetical protein
MIVLKCSIEEYSVFVDWIKLPEDIVNIDMNVQAPWKGEISSIINWLPSL